MFCATTSIYKRRSAGKITCISVEYNFPIEQFYIKLHLCVVPLALAVQVWSFGTCNWKSGCLEQEAVDGRVEGGARGVLRDKRRVMSSSNTRGWEVTPEGVFSV